MAFLKIRPGDEPGIEERNERKEGVDWKAPINKTPLAVALHLLRASTKHDSLVIFTEDEFICLSDGKVRKVLNAIGLAFAPSYKEFATHINEV